MLGRFSLIEIRQFRPGWDGPAIWKPASLQCCGDARFFCREASGDHFIGHTFGMRTSPNKLLQPADPVHTGEADQRAGVTDDDSSHCLQGVKVGRWFRLPSDGSPGSPAARDGR